MERGHVAAENLMCLVEWRATLESKGLIRSSRGAIVVRNRKGIERSAGGTYGVPEKELRRLIG
jgi:hypothetical protein